MVNGGNFPAKCSLLTVAELCNRMHLSKPAELYTSTWRILHE